MIQDFVTALIHEGVSVEDFLKFSSEWGLTDVHFIHTIVYHLNVAYSWLNDEYDECMEHFQSPETTQSTLEEEFEPWSPGFESAVYEYEDMASSSLACVNNGEYKTGKTFYCARCKSTFMGYEAYNRHRSTHAKPVDVTGPCFSTYNGDEDMSGAGPSGTYSNSTNISDDMSDHGSNGIHNEQAVQPYSDQTIRGQFGGVDPYVIELFGTRRFAKATAEEKTYKVRFNDIWQGRRLSDIRRELHRLFEDLLSMAREGINDNDLLRVVIRHDALNHAVVIPLQAAGDMNVEKILSKLENVLQSEEKLSIDDSFKVMIGALHIPQGRGGPRRRLTKLTGPDNSIHRKSSMVQIVNDDQLCMARAIGVGLAKTCLVTDDVWKAIKRDCWHLTNPEIVLTERKILTSAFKNICNKNRQEQKQLATLLCQKACIPTDRPGSLNDLPVFEEALQVRIAVVAASLGNKFIRVPSNEHEDWPLIYLYLVDHQGVSHFHAITNILGFFSVSYFCERCFKQYNTNTKHRCETTCLTCKSQHCPETDSPVSCRDCHMVCRSSDCFDRHKAVKTNREDGKLTLSSCDKYWRCTTCKKVINREKRSETKHECSEWLCKCCRTWVIGNHRCYLFPEEVKKPIKRFVYFDFETTQSTIAQCKEGYSPKNCCQDPCKDCTKCQRCFKSWCGQAQHVPNFVIAQTVCEYCCDEPMDVCSTCSYCGTRCSVCDDVDPKLKEFSGPPCPGRCGFREVIFRGDSTLDEFGRWLFSDQHKDVTVMAHNMKGYDGVFLMEYLINNSMRPSKVIYNGSKIMYLEVAKGLNIRVLDSLNFLPMKLSALPKAFELTELCKGYFPHFFNTRENQNYVGPYPDPKAYGVDYMNSDDRASFLLWHKAKIDNGDVFDFSLEIENYCRSDVDILRRACLRFRQLMIDVTEVDPFQYITIASVCMAIYKTKFLEADYKLKLLDPLGHVSSWIPSRRTPKGWLVKFDPKKWEPKPDNESIAAKIPVKSSIAQVPSAGYVQKDTFSKASIQWLEYEMELAKRNGESLHIRHALNGGEECILGTPYKVDGRDGKTVYEYHGCLWHGCTKCYKDRSVKHPKTGQSLDELYALTMIKKKTLTDLQFEYVCMWEHDWLKRTRDDPDVRDFVEGLDIQDRLDPRESFFGGRTNAVKLSYTANEGETIKYVDFTSLYPYVNKYCRYPVGHPEIITEDFQDLSNYFGIAKVKIVAPRGLYHPVLPYRSNGKLKFALCRTCADDECISTCSHDLEERAFVGTWCTPEIEMAIEKGYSLLKIYEVYHWDQTSQYDQTTKEGGLFATYVNTFLKIKQEASGWPDWCKTDEDKKRYVQDYSDKEGIRLDSENIKTNPGLRALAKLCLNSFWGKFGQRLNQGVSEFIHESQLNKFFQTLTDGTKKVNDFHIISEEHIHIEYEHQSGFVPEDMKTNVILATFTTCSARLKLYGVLDQLGERVLYYDTDSIVYVSKPCQFDPPLGDYLGELTNELDAGDHIVEFVSGGPKNYAYTTARGKQTCKIRGFNLNYTNGRLLNFDSVRDMVDLVRPDQPQTYKKRKLDDGEQPPSKVIITTNPTKITRDKYANVLYNREESKQYRVVYDKRVIRADYDTVPYGY